MNLMEGALSDALSRWGFRLLPGSLREIPGRGWVFAARGPREKAVGWVGEPDFLPLTSPLLPEPIRAGNYPANLYPWTWGNYLALRSVLSLAPQRCDRPASFGTGDRLGWLSRAQIEALRLYPVFPILAQQSPRELERTKRDFRDVLLQAAWGVLASGYAGAFGADADHIKTAEQLREAVEAGYTMFTLDLSEHLRQPAPREPSPLARAIVEAHAGHRLSVADGQGYILEEGRLWKAAQRYEPALEAAIALVGQLRAWRREFDLEISVDEAEEETTPEDHVFVVEYLRRRGVDLWSLAPRFPGRFEKGVDYIGEVEAFARALRLHVAISRALDGYRISLHSGSDKFRIYRAFAEITGGRFHIKTSGTSWLQTLRVIARVDPGLFAELYRTSLDHLEESRKAYPISLRREDLPLELPSNPEQLLEHPAARQLLHISYGVLLDAYREALQGALEAHWEELETAVREHICRHLDALFVREVR